MNETILNGKLLTWTDKIFEQINIIEGTKNTMETKHDFTQGNILKSLKSKRLYYLSFIKLIVYPLAGLVVLWLLPLEFEVAFTVFIALACPAGASVIMFAQRYDRDAYYASEIFVITTLLSVVTIPLLSIVAVNLLS